MPKPIPHGTRGGYIRHKCRCSPCVDANREYLRRYREDNAERIAQADRRWLEANREKAAESRRRWSEANHEKKLEDQRQWRRGNVAKVAEHGRAYREANAERISEAQRRWREANPGRVAASRNLREHRRRARLRDAFIEDVPRLEIFERDNWQCMISGCLYPGIPASLDVAHTDPTYASVDHAVPLSRGGLHERRNLQTAHLGCNVAKQSRIEGIA